MEFKNVKFITIASVLSMLAKADLVSDSCPTSQSATCEFYNAACPAGSTEQYCEQAISYVCADSANSFCPEGSDGTNNSTFLVLDTLTVSNLVAAEGSSICAEMPNMGACSGPDSCPAPASAEVPSECNGKLLENFGKLCIDMPMMSQCGQWREMCNSVGNVTTFCGAESNPTGGSSTNDGGNQGGSGNNESGGVVKNLSFVAAAVSIAAASFFLL